MRHRRSGRKLNRSPSHRKAMEKNMAQSLFRHESIVTTKPKARQARRLVEHCITLAKEGGLHRRRQALSLLQDKEIVKKLFDEIAPRFKNRKGGYTRILHGARSNPKSAHERPSYIHMNRLGDNAPRVVFALVEADSTTSTEPETAGAKRAAKEKTEKK